MITALAINKKCTLINCVCLTLFCAEISDYHPGGHFGGNDKIVITTAYLCLAIFEHFCSLVSFFCNLQIDIVESNLTVADPVELFITRHIGYSVNNIPYRYNHFLGFFLEYLNFSCTIWWNFLDLFIVLISIGISFLFERVNIRMQNLKGLMLDENVWAEIRYHHFQVLELLQTVNESLNEMLILACFSDGYVILCQLVNITT